MGRLVALAVVTGLTGCETIFPLEPPDHALRPGCSSMGILATNFDQGLDPDPLFPGKYSTDSTTIRINIAAGALQIDADTQGYGEATANRFFDFRDSSFSVAVSGELPVTGEIGFELTTPDDQFRLRMLRRNEELVMARVEEGVELEVARLPYDGTEQAIWKISRAGDDVTWSTAPLDGTFVDHITFPGLTYATFLMPRLMVRRLMDSANTVNGRFDNINGGVPVGVACGAFELSDNFNDGTISELWRPDPHLVEADKTLTLNLEPNGGLAETTLTATTLYDLREDAISFELAAPPPAVALELQLATIDGARADFRFANNMLASFRDGAMTGGAVFDFAIHRWWRMRNEGDTLFFETSPDGVEFSVFGVTNAVPGLDRCDIRIDAFGAIGSPQAVTIDNFNNLP